MLRAGVDLQPLVLATAAMDSTGMYHDLAFGSQSTVSGLVALLAAADALGKVMFRYSLCKSNHV